MPMLASSLGSLNAAFQQSKVADNVHHAEAFAEGQPLHEALAGVAADPGSVEHRLFRAYLAKMPSALQESLRSVVRLALTSSPPLMVTFAWTAAYDWHLDLWQGPCQVTVLIRSRYPDDARPSAGDGDGAA
jgi:hypothetical protein